MMYPTSPVSPGAWAASPPFKVASAYSQPAYPLMPTLSLPVQPVQAYMPPMALSVSQPVSMPVVSPLKNGMQVLLQHAPQTPDCELRVQIDTPFQSSVVNSMMGALITEGSPQTKALLNELSSRGIDVGFASSPKGMALILSGLKGQEEELVKWAGHLLNNPTIDPWTFNTLHQDTIKSAEENAQQPDVVLADALLQTFYGAHNPWATTSQETLQQLKQIQLGPLMGMYQQTIQRPSGLRAVFNSPLPLDRQQQLLNQGWPSAPQAPVMSPVVEYPLAFQGPSVHKQVLVEKDDVKRAFLQKVWQAPKLGDPDYAAFLLLREVLASQSWGFFRELRMRRGLIYRSNKDYSARPQAHHYSVGFEVDFDKIPQGIDGIQAVVSDVMNNGITPEQLVAAKKRAILDVRQVIETNGGLNGLNSRYIESGLMPPHPQTLLQAINQVQLQDIKAVANRVFGKQTPSVLGIMAPKAVLTQFKAQQAQQPPI